MSVMGSSGSGSVSVSGSKTLCFVDTDTDPDPDADVDGCISILRIATLDAADLTFRPVSEETVRHAASRP